MKCVCRAWALGWVVLMGCGGAPSKAPAGPGLAQSPPSAPAKPAARDAEATANAFLESLKAADFAAAAAYFGPSLQAAVSVEQLAGGWKGLAGPIGSLASWKLVQSAVQGGIEVRVFALSFEKGEALALIAVDPATQKLEGFQLKPAPAPYETAPYVDGSKFESKEVSVGAEPFLLGGTLTLPRGKGPFPGVVLVHGSGPNDRDETMGPNKPFRDIGEALASRGVAVLRYDKRTFAHGATLSNSISIDDEVVLDAVAAVALLKARPEIDPKRVFVAGHSLGAGLAPEIGKRAAPVAGLMLLAPPARPPLEVVAEQLRYLEAPAETIVEVDKAIARFKAGTLGEGVILGGPASYWADLTARDGIAAAKGQKTPMLIMRGDRDYQVTDADHAAWRKAFGRSSRARFITFPKLNHLFIAGEGKPTPAEYEVPGHVEVSVIDALAAFVSAR